MHVRTTTWIIGSVGAGGKRVAATGTTQDHEEGDADGGSEGGGPGVVVFSTDARPAKRRKPNPERAPRGVPIGPASKKVSAL